MFQLARIHIAAIALVIIIAIGAALFMTQIKPRQESMAKLKKDIKAQEDIIATRPQKEAQLWQAEDKARIAKADWEQIMLDKMSQIELDDLHKAMFAINLESDTYGPQLAAGLNHDPRVRFTGGLSFPGIGWREPTVDISPRVFQQTITLNAKDFTSVKDWLRSTKQLPRVLGLGNQITLTATNPRIAVTVPGTVTIFYRTPATAAAPAAAATTAPAAGGTGGMGGPMMGPGGMGRMGGGMGGGMMPGMPGGMGGPMGPGGMGGRGG